MKRNIGTILAFIFLVLFLLYGGFEVAKVALGPSLTVTSPKDLDTVHDPLVHLTGHVARAAYISVDDRQIFADESGMFTESLLLLPGYNIIKVKVLDRFGKEKSKQITISYVPSN
jgi:hypothetical protein